MYCWYGRYTFEILFLQARKASSQEERPSPGGEEGEGKGILFYFEQEERKQD